MEKRKVRQVAMAICASLLLTCDAMAQGLNQASFQLIESAMAARTSRELAAIAETLPIANEVEALWRDAVRIQVSAEMDTGEAAFRRGSIARLMEAALFLRGVALEETSLDDLAAEDVAEMQAAIGFPDRGDLLIHLLRRGPSLRDEFSFETYSAIRHVVPFSTTRRLVEHVSRPYLGIATDYSTTRDIAAQDDPVALASGELGKARSINLIAVPDVVLAAKAFRAAARAPGDREYALLVAARAMERALRADTTEEMRPAFYAAQLQSREALRNYQGTDEFLRAEANAEAVRFPVSAFWARQFAEAARAYALAAGPGSEASLMLWSAWGEALSLFAYGDAAAGAAFARVGDLLEHDDGRLSAFLALFLRYLPSGEADLVGGVSSLVRLTERVNATYGERRKEWRSSGSGTLHASWRRSGDRELGADS